MTQTDIVISRLTSADIMLAEAQTPADAANVADIAEAARVYAKRAKAALPVINKATAIKLKAERRAGEMLADMPKLSGSRGVGKKVELHDATPLSEMGITKTQSSRWQRAAIVPEDKFQEFIQEANEKGKEISTAGLLKLANTIAPKNEAKPAERTDGICTDINELVASGQKFGTIYADPPWRYQNQGTRAATGNHYDGDLSIEQLCQMPIGQLAAEKCHLHLWTTNAFLFDCPRLFEAWGFTFKSSFVWVKPQMGIGNYWRNSHEIMLLAIRGGQTSISKAEKSWLECKRGMHSAKPEAVRHSIERLSPGPYLELFGRAPRTGWTVFGNQIVAEELKL